MFPKVFYSIEKYNIYKVFIYKNLFCSLVVEFPLWGQNSDFGNRIPILGMEFRFWLQNSYFGNRIPNTNPFVAFFYIFLLTLSKNFLKHKVFSSPFLQTFFHNISYKIPEICLKSGSAGIVSIPGTCGSVSPQGPFFNIFFK